jgi:cytochrome P450
MCLSRWAWRRRRPRPRCWLKCGFPVYPECPPRADENKRIAGSEPTATAIRHTLLQLAGNAPVLKTLRAEMAKCVVSRPIKNSEAQKMPYLDAVIKESLRTFPPVSGLMSKAVPEGGDNFKGTYLPAGTTVAFSTFAACRDKIFGEDATTFRPERWLYDDEDVIKEREATLGLVFGQGRWLCVGRELALMEIRKVVVEVRMTCSPLCLDVVADTKR